MIKKFKHQYSLKNCLFGFVKLAKNAGPDKYKYSSYDICFNSRSEFLFSNRSIGKNVIVFGSDMN